MSEYKKARKYHQFIKFYRELKVSGLRNLKKYEAVLFWFRNNLSRSQFLILSGILVGCTSGLAGIALKTLVHYIHYIITYKVRFEDQIIFYIVFPFLGIVLTTGVVLFVFKGQDRKGIPAILYEIARNSSLVSSVKMYSQIIQSAITVGLGGSAGLESPMAVTGAAIGSNYARTYQLDYKERTLLLAAGATAGIASAFNAPIAGMMFAFEILLTGVVFSDFIPLVVAAVCGSLLSKIILNEDILFQFYARDVFNYNNTPYYIVLGICCGLYARYFVIISQKTEHFFKALPWSRIRKAMLGGALLSLLCVLLPPLFGEGYLVIKELANGQVESIVSLSFLKYLPYHSWYVLLLLGLICLFKAFATPITIYSGGNGGNFAPSLFAGGTFGYFIAMCCVSLGLPDVPVTNLVLVGMAGVMSGVLYAPLTAIFLIAESSSGYDLFIPLMIVSVISFLIAKWFSPISPDLKKMAEEGKIFTHAHDQNLLAVMNVKELLEKDNLVIDINASFPEIIELVKQGKRNIIAVTSHAQRFEGVITLDDIRPVMFNADIYEMLTVRKVMKAPPAVIQINDDLRNIIKKFDETNSWNLPVVSDNQFVGFLSKSAILDKYRRQLKEYSL